MNFSFTKLTIRYLRESLIDIRKSKDLYFLIQTANLSQKELSHMLEPLKYLSEEEREKILITDLREIIIDRIKERIKKYLIIVKDEEL